MLSLASPCRRAWCGICQVGFFSSEQSEHQAAAKLSSLDIMQWSWRARFSVWKEAICGFAGYPACPSQAVQGVYRAPVYPMSLLPWQIWFSSMVPTRQPLNPALTVHHPKSMKASNSFPLEILINVFILYIINYLLVTTFCSCLSHLLWLIALFHALRTPPNTGR